MKKKPSDLLAPYSDAGYPVVAIETCEGNRLLDSCMKRWPKSQFFSISAAGGLLKHEKSSDGEDRQKLVDATFNFQKAFTQIGNVDESFLLVNDFQHIINGAAAYRPLLQALPSCKSRGSMIVLVAPSWNLPAELKHEIPVVNLPLPSPEELEDPLQTTCEAAKQEPEDRADLISSARGLTMSEAENVFALSSLDKFSKSVVEREKMKLVRSACMTVENPTDPALLAGLGQLKAYIYNEVLPSRDDDQLRVRGILLVGVPGSGKSLSARVIAAILRWPLVRFDMSAAKGSLMGQSERNVRESLGMADAIAPCVLWADEIEKAVGGHASSGVTDSGTTLGMVGTLLTWQQEHISPVLMVATCNDFSKLPAEMTRAGRFDERFFLDLPSQTEREAIALVHLKRLRCKEELAPFIAGKTIDWTGAEVEQLIKSAARRTKRDLNIGTLESCASEIIPISRSTGIQQLREWAGQHLRRANDAENAKTGRRVKKGGDVNPYMPDMPGEA